jgi:hypothetical protein
MSSAPEALSVRLVPLPQYDTKRTTSACSARAAVPSDIPRKHVNAPIAWRCARSAATNVVGSALP